MKRVRAKRVAAVSAALVAVTLVTVPMTGAASAADGAAVSSAKPRKVKRYMPPQGPHFNNPLGKGPARYRTLNVVQAAMQHARKGSTIRIMSWNIQSRSVVDYLLRAQRRGVRVLVIMDKGNLTEIPNPSFRRLRGGLAKGNKQMKLAPKRRSYAKVCDHSCRGPRGQAHAKYFLFSATGGAKRVVMEGSMNLTAASAVNQWNDVFVMNNTGLYPFARTVFTQMWRDKPVAQPWVSERRGAVRMMFTPERGPKFHVDPRLRLLNEVKCWGARGAGRNGRTIIRTSPDVVRNKLGMAVARKLRQLYQNGCDVRIGYTVLGVDVHRVLTTPGRRGKVPLKHLVQDFNGDGEFDNYFHLKVLTINGRLGTNRGAHVAVNGSANVSGLAAASDENIAVIRRKPATMSYQSYIDYWWTHFPKSKKLTSSTLQARRLGTIDPYAHVDMD